MPFKSFKEESRINWGRELCNKQFLSNEEMQLGAIMRIADASEKIATNYQALLDARDRYKRWYEDERKMNRHLANKIRGLRGYIKRLRDNKCKSSS